MSSSHPFTLVDDDEDLDDICPVCDGECTCRPKPRPSVPIPSSHVGSYSSANMRAPAAPAHSPPSAMQSLKIKFPAGMLSKARAAQKIKSDDAETSSPFSAQPFFAQPVASGSSLAPKKRGRPPKGPHRKAAAGSDQDESSGPYRLLKRKETVSRAKPKPKTKPVKSLKGKGTTGKKGKSAATHSAAHKKKAVSSEDDFGGSDLTDIDGIDDNDGVAARFPTFMSASALSTSTFSSSDSDSSISDLDTDSSMEAEEENYILTEERRNEKARVRRELLGDEGAKRKIPHNNWVIKARKQSVGLSDVDMDVDSDATEDEEEEEDEEEGIEADETDENALSTYAGVATGWSEEEEEDDGEESGFDAELFFANLSDSTEDSASSDEGGDADADRTEVDADMTDSFHAARLQMANLPFEVSQGWDGQIVFSNGLHEGQGILDLDFEVSAAQLVEDSASPTLDETDIEMQTSEGEDDGEYEEIGDEEASDGGDTTDDDYVDADGLPTKRMLELFCWPSSLSAIDPMSTVSPAVSPSPLNRRHRRSFGSGSLDTGSPRPADILAGKVFWDDTDSQDRDRTPEASIISSPRGAPFMGKFEAAESPRRAILTGAYKNVPSPFPRTRHRRRGSSLSSSMDPRGRSLTRPHSLSISTPSLTMQSLAMQAMSSTDGHLSSDNALAEAIELHDVLDVAFLDSDATELTAGSGPSASEGESRRAQAMPRWDQVPMGTFRRTREGGVIISDSGSAAWQAETPRVTPADAFVQGSSHHRLLKSSPFSEITWHGRGSTTNPPKGKGARRMSSASRHHPILSPVILPVRDGDRTPTNVPPPPSPPQQESFPRKTRKELRRETKMKRKSYGPVHHQHQGRQHFHHSHHPNMKSRSTNAVQRTNFFNSPTGSVPPFNL